jgi:hypothetical protein
VCSDFFELAYIAALLTKECIIDVCIANDPVILAKAGKPGLPLEALRSLAMQASIESDKSNRNTTNR